MDLTARVAHLEDDMKEVKAALTRIEPVVARVDTRLKGMPSAVDIGEIKGRIAGLPTWWQLLVANLALAIAVAGLVFTVIRFGGGLR